MKTHIKINKMLVGIDRFKEIYVEEKALFVPLKCVLSDRKTTTVVGVLRLSRNDMEPKFKYLDKMIITYLQNLIAVLFLVYKERCRFLLSDMIIKSLVGKSTLWSL